MCPAGDRLVLVAARPAAARPRTSGSSAPSPRRPPRCSSAARLAEQAAAAEPLAEADRLRTALLAAVGHDLRTPLAVGQGGGDQPAQRRRRVVRAGPDELLLTADESLDRLAAWSTTCWT